MNGDEKSNITFPTTVMGDDKVDDVPSARMSDDGKSHDGSRRRQGISIPDFNHNKSKQTQKGTTIFGGGAGKNTVTAFGKKRQNYLNHS